MDKAIKEKWIKALRSGRYKQGIQQLYNPSTKGYCCLGVLAKIQGAKLEQLAESMFLEYELKVYACDIRPKSQRVLSRMNDGGGPYEKSGKTFKEIADYIEKRY